MSYYNDKRRIERAQLKIEVMTHYGNGKQACVNCGENRLACLSIDHINNNGAKHRREESRVKNDFYPWLKEHKFPKGYQTLCMNCQWIKRIAYRKTVFNSKKEKLEQGVE